MYTADPFGLPGRRSVVSFPYRRFWRNPGGGGNRIQIGKQRPINIQLCCPMHRPLFKERTPSFLVQLLPLFVWIVQHSWIVITLPCLTMYFYVLRTSWNEIGTREGPPPLDVNTENVIPFKCTFIRLPRTQIAEKLAADFVYHLILLSILIALSATRTDRQSICN